LLLIILFNVGKLEIWSFFCNCGWERWHLRSW